MALLEFENPALAEVFTSGGEHDTPEGLTPWGGHHSMTVEGAVGKSAVLVGVLVSGAALAWRLADIGPAVAWLVLFTALLGATGVGVWTAARPARASRTAVVYAALEGACLGALSFLADQKLPGLVVQAMAATFAVLAAMLLAYRLGLIRATPKLTRFVVTATGAVFVIYVVEAVLAVAGVEVPLLHQGGFWGVLVSLAVIGLVGLNLVVDFAFIEQGARDGADQRLEWYAAFGLVVTLVWLYVEVLDFIVKVAGDDD